MINIRHLFLNHYECIRIYAVNALINNIIQQTSQQVHIPEIKPVKTRKRTDKSIRNSEGKRVNFIGSTFVKLYKLLVKRKKTIDVDFPKLYESMSENNKVKIADILTSLKTFFCGRDTKRNRYKIDTYSKLEEFFTCAAVPTYDIKSCIKNALIDTFSSDTLYAEMIDFGTSSALTRDSLIRHRYAIFEKLLLHMKM